MGKDFKDRLRGFRLALAKRKGQDVRPADVARHMGVSRAAYNHWEQGKRKPKNIGVYRRLAQFFGVGLSDFGVDINDMAPERGTGAPPDRRAKGQRVTKPTPEEKKG